MISELSQSPVLSATVGLITGAAVTATFSWLSDWAKQRRDAVFSLHKEWYEMMDLRVEVDRLMVSHRRVKDGVSDELLNKLWKIMAFYERLYFYYRSRGISRKLVRDLFGENLHWWHQKAFISHLNQYPESQTSIDCFKLHAGVWKSASASQREKWDKHASGGVTIERGKFKEPA